MTPKKALYVLVGVLFLLVLRSIGSGQETATQPPPIESMADLEALFASEPGYNEIQETAMRFAEVHPDKIAAWRRGASLRAFLPEVTFRYEISTLHDTGSLTSYDWSESAEHQYQYGEMTSTGSERRHEEGEELSNAGYAWSMKDVTSRESGQAWSSSEQDRSGYGYLSGNLDDTDDRNEKGWGLMFKWDLRDFIYNDEQTKISKEARDLVELRQDVLEQVNTYFFDRRRAQIEMIFSPPSDVRSKIDLQLRIARLTANIDALTGGFLSARLANLQPAS